MSSAWPQYQGNFSIFLLCPQTGPFAHANKGLFMGNIVHHLLLHCIFYACLPQSIFTDKCHCLPLQMAPRAKHRKLRGSAKVTRKVRAEVGTELRAPCSQAYHLLPRRPSWKQVSPECPSHTPAACQPPHLCSLKFRTQTSSSYPALHRPLDGRGHLAKSIEGRWTCQDPGGWEEA